MRVVRIVWCIKRFAGGTTKWTIHINATAEYFRSTELRRNGNHIENDNNWQIYWGTHMHSRSTAYRMLNSWQEANELIHVYWTTIYCRQSHIEFISFLQHQPPARIFCWFARIQPRDESIKKGKKIFTLLPFNTCFISESLLASCCASFRRW